MTKYRDSDVTILRIAGDNDPGYDPRIPKVFIRTPKGEQMVLRSDLDESMDVSEDERKAMARAQGRSDAPTDMRTEEIRREARRRGMPPDQTPAPFLTTATGRQVPNPDALETDGRAPTLEQEKQGQPTHPTGFQQGRLAVGDRGDPRGGAGAMGGDADAQAEGRPHGSLSAQEQAQKESSERALAEDAEKAKQQQADQQKAEQEKQASQQADASKEADADQQRRNAEQEAEKARQENEGKTDPAAGSPENPLREKNAPPKGTPEGLGEDQRKTRALEEGTIHPA